MVHVERAGDVEALHDERSFQVQVAADARIRPTTRVSSSSIVLCPVETQNLASLRRFPVATIDPVADAEARRACLEGVDAAAQFPERIVDLQRVDLRLHGIRDVLLHGEVAQGFGEHHFHSVVQRQP
jgi:hypothetical protein